MMITEAASKFYGTGATSFSGPGESSLLRQQPLGL
jgi:hypothetical protein